MLTLFNRDRSAAACQLPVLRTAPPIATKSTLPGLGRTHQRSVVGITPGGERLALHVVVRTAEPRFAVTSHGVPPPVVRAGEDRPSIGFVRKVHRSATSESFLQPGEVETARIASSPSPGLSPVPAGWRSHRRKHARAGSAMPLRDPAGRFPWVIARTALRLVGASAWSSARRRLAARRSTCRAQSRRDRYAGGRPSACLPGRRRFWRRSYSRTACPSQRLP